MKIKIVAGILLILAAGNNLYAGGISVDAGITPPQDRFIFRTQYRLMSMENSMMKMNAHMVPVVLAYGVTSGFTVMARGMYVARINETSSQTTKGINDLFLLTKFRLYRINTARYVLGVAPHIASNIPIGSKQVSNRTWDPELGLNISFRPRFFSVDVSVSYVFSDISGKLNVTPGDIFNMNAAFSTVIPFKNNTNNALIPVLETTFISQQESETVPSNQILFLSPGVSFIHSNLSFEALVQFPVYQTEDMNILDQSTRYIVGVKYMF